MDEEKDEFLFFGELRERKEFVFIFSYGMISCREINFGDWVC